MKLQKKLFRAFSLNIILLVLIGLVNSVFIMNSQNLLKQLSNEIFTSHQYIDSIWLDINTIYGEILSLMLQPESGTSVDEQDETALDFYTNLELLMEMFPENHTQFTTIEEAFREFYLYGKWLQQQYGSRNISSVSDAIGKFKIQKDKLFESIENTVAKYEEIHVETFRQIERQASWSISISISVILFGVFLSFLSSLFLSRSIASPVLKLTAMVNKMESGNFNMNHHINSNDEIGRLADAFTSMSGKLHRSFEELRTEIEEREKIEKELIGSRGSLQYLKSLLESILDSVTNMVIAVDGEGLVTHWNHSAEMFSGVIADEAIGREIHSLIPEIITDVSQWESCVKTKCQKKMTKQKRIVHNRSCYFNISLYPHKNSELKGLVIVIQDITESINTEEVMIQSEKMLSIGGLAAGMAHEINNPLAGMIQTANVMANRLFGNLDKPANRKAAEQAGISIENLKDFMESRGIPKMIQSINESGKRAADIVENMLSFARKEDDTKSTHSLVEILNKTLNLAKTDYDLKKDYDFRNIEIVTEIGENLPSILCVSSKLQQVILNILRNGAQAMQSANIEHPQFIIRLKELPEKNMLSLEIEDNGPGMDENIRKRIFEPFFTTKKKGVGTGLGLSVSYFIITETHQGEMIVNSAVNQGASFTINLPVAVFY